jgi:hypothetical protein
MFDLLPRWGCSSVLGERVNGIQEVGGSIPFSSTNKIKHFLGLRARIPRKFVRIVQDKASARVNIIQ